MDTLEIRFDYQEDEYVRAVQHYYRVHKTVRKRDFYLLSDACLLLAALLLLDRPRTWYLVLMGLDLLVLTLGFYIYSIRPRHYFRRTPSFHEQQFFRFSEDQIEFQSPSVQSTLQWDAFREIWRSAEVYLLIREPHVYVILPRRAFATAAAAEQFESWAAANIKPVRAV